ncbi:formate dehydrogenase accessory sulfurtransferase FdhD [Paenibacillus hexagrammi]|uniref:Sulfur carrier protein FdhD n=1 Tax=Paenibacillus hexagrammi TaxID=2908839 RepID=A0ABY3SSG1_9BACL|nr:formate dehydrogenase accessory sulfurtransferase FdhD [Paenibacillus sp. YPD9-1]UJF36515.1 formate dehydrogenase accessory sulfurtransferase FdhD [Paenibacillus sp. YPD9-1]
MTWEVHRYAGSSVEGPRYKVESDDIAVEAPLTVKVDGEEFATLVCTPTDVEELIVGFLASEGLIRFADQVKSLSVDAVRGYAYVKLVNRHQRSTEQVAKRWIGSCCGKSRQFYFQNDVQTAKTVRTDLRVSIHQCLQLMKALQEQSTDFQATGGLHNGALCSPESLLLTRSDIGRHNALDKIFGHVLMNRLPVRDKLIAFSGRISSEVLLKVSKIGAGILLSKSAPTDLALRLAQDLGITVVGFIRGDHLTVYTHPQRIAEWKE